MSASPILSGPRRKLGCALVGLSLFAGGLLVNDRLEARGRELVVLNRSGRPATLRVGARSEVVGETPLRLALGEGSHEVEVQLGDDAPRALQVELRGTVLSRLLGGRVSLLNLEAAAPILWEETIYGPAEGEAPSPPRIALGELLSFERVDDLFVPFPSEGGQGPRVRITVAPGEPETILGALAPARRVEPGALSFAEHHLRRAPDSSALLDLYRDAARAGDPARGASFFAQRVGLRPVEMRWHRAYQDLRRAAGEEEALRAEYAACAATAPQDADLRVLVGRIAGDPDQALADYRAALALDAGCAFAHYGVAVHLFRRADYAGARTHAEAACRARPRDGDLAHLRYLVRCAQGEWAALAREFGQAQAAAPTSLSLFERRQEALLASGQAEAARAAFQAYRQGWIDRPDPKQVALLASVCVHELSADWEGLRKLLPQLEDADHRARLSFRAALGAGRPAEAGAPSSLAERLQLSLAWALLEPVDSAASARAEEERQALLSAAAQGSGAWPSLAEAFRAGAPEAIQKLALPPEDKACALLLLARARPEAERAALRALAKRYDFGLRHPHALLQAALAK